MQICSATAPYGPLGGPSVATASYWEFDATPPWWLSFGGHNEFFTYMINLELCGYKNCAYSPAVPPAPYDSDCPMVFTGIKKYPFIHKSIGRTISRTIPSPHCDGTTGAATPGWNDYSTAGPDYAKSFWDMYVYVHIPSGPGTDVPGFFLFNDPADLDALLIVNDQVEDLPPNPVYVHTGSTSVPFKMLSAGSDVSGTITWTAGEVFGYLKLAGHQINLVCAKSTDVAAFVDNVLGTDKQEKAGPPTLWVFPNNLFPSIGASYRSVPGTNFQGGSASQVEFTNGTTTIYVRSLKKGNFLNPIAPPAPTSTATYSTLTSADTLEISMDGTTFYPATGSGPFETAITWLTNANNTTTYDLAIHSRTNTYSSPLGGFKLRESPTLSSVGQHIVKTTSSTTKAASFFDVWFEINMGGGQPWLVANRSIRMEVTEPACGTPGNISATINGNFVTLTWGGGNFRLQRSSSLDPVNWVDVTGVSPITLPITGLSFFRLVCP